MLAILDTCVIRGVFCSADGVPWSDEDIATAIGGDRAENLSCVAELVAKGVCSRNKQGAIFCRRFLREEQERAANRGYVQAYRDRKKGECKTDVMADVLILNSKEVELKPKKEKPNIETFDPNDSHFQIASDLGLNLALCLASFKDYCLSKSPNYKNLDAAFRNWLRNDAKFSRNSNGQASKQQERRTNNRSAITDGFRAHIGAVAGHGSKPLQVRSDSAREPVVGRDTLPLLPGRD